MNVLSPTNHQKKASVVARALFVGLFLTCGHIAFALHIQNGTTTNPSVFNFIQSDARWYNDIVSNGYKFSLNPSWIPSGIGMKEATTGFLPGYPLAIWLTKKITLATTEASMLIVAYLASWGFWTYLLLLLKQWKISTNLQILSVALIITHPASFFLVSSYSESLYYMTIMGFFYWVGQKGRLSTPAAILHGMVMTATRIPGFIFALYPLFIELVEAVFLKKSQRSTLRAFSRRSMFIALGACSGLGLFFVYCQLKFGEWNAYALSQGLYNKIDPQLFTPWNPHAILALFPVVSYLRGEGYDIFGVIATPLTVWMFFLVVIFILLKKKTIVRYEYLGQVGALVLCSGLLLYMHLSIFLNSQLLLFGMLRHTHSVYILLVLLLVHILQSVRFTLQKIKKELCQILILYVLLSNLIFQGVLITLFTRGIWIA